MTLVTLRALWPWIEPRRRPLLLGWFALLSASVLVTHQHHVADRRGQRHGARLAADARARQRGPLGIAVLREGQCPCRLAITVFLAQVAASDALAFLAPGAAAASIVPGLDRVDSINALPPRGKRG